MNTDPATVITLLGVNAFAVLMAGVVLKLVRIKQMSLGDVLGLTLVATLLALFEHFTDPLWVCVTMFVGTLIYQCAWWVIRKPARDEQGS